MNNATTAVRSLPTGTADYAPAASEARWQAAWEQARAFATPPRSDRREPAYVLAGNIAAAESLEIGHIRGYTIADAHARFLRARGRAVLFSVGFDTSAPRAENELGQQGITPSEGMARRCAPLRALGCSIDWERSFAVSEPDHHRWTERPFSALVERGAIYRHGGRTDEWRLRVAAYVRHCERDLDALPGWDDAALAAQREVLGRVDGVELDASTFDGTLLTVFTPHPDAIAKAAFVAVAGDHPDAERWNAGAFATVPGVAGMLPIVVCEEVSARFGATAAVLGIPAEDPADAAIAGRLPESAGTTWKTSRTSTAPRPAARWRARDVAISSQSAIWWWLALCIPPEERGDEQPEHLEYTRWLSATQIVGSADAAEAMLHQRVLAKALRDAGQLPELAGGEPFANALTYGAIRVEGHTPGEPHGEIGVLDPLPAAVGADVLRLALLHAAAPRTAFAWNDQPLRHCNNFLQSLHGYAAGRLREWSPHVDGAAGIDPSDRLRRRLARWCGVAYEKVTDSLERLQMQRAAHNAMLLLNRIEDFERRALALRGGELESSDREAIMAALLLLVQLLAPLTPHIAEELWSLAGNNSLVSVAPWPAAQATPAGTARSRRTAASTSSRAS
ncbi:MAG TPA: class I tRNA ligase family protein [Solirubrobacteraceae bacterium]|jgi:leucyl-tRNA synthetase|nr:class I tRNA ligase family protein [Solirubrobacteraceae bacterium]